MGPAGLNFRVRDGNGCDPRGVITDKVDRARSRAKAISNKQSAISKAGLAYRLPLTAYR